MPNRMKAMTDFKTRLPRVREAYDSLVRLLRDTADAAVLNQLAVLNVAITEAENKPQTYMRTMGLVVPDHWVQWHETLGYAGKPYVRDDNLTVFQETPGGVYYAKFATGDYVTDAVGRKRFWKYWQTAMAYLDRDIPLSGDPE